MPNVKPRQVLEWCDKWEQYFEAHRGKIGGRLFSDFPLTPNFNKISQDLRDWTLDQGIADGDASGDAFTAFTKSARQFPRVSFAKEKKRLLDEMARAAMAIKLLLPEIRERANHLLGQAKAMPAPDVRNAVRRKVASIIVAILVCFIFEVAVNSFLRWDWLLSHPNSYGLQVCICLMASFGIVGLWVRPWRKALWGTGIFGVIFAAVGILGGPTK